MDSTKTQILTQALNAVEGSVFVVEPTSEGYKILFANQSTYQLLNLHESIEGQYIRHILPTNKKRWIRRQFEKVVLAQKAITIDIPTDREMSKAQHWRLNLKPIVEGQVVTSIIGTITVQTEQVRSRQKVREGQRYVAALEQAPYGVCFVNGEGETTMVNRTLCHWLDRSMESFSTQSISDFIHVDDAQVFAQALTKVMAGQRSYDGIEVRLQLPEKIMWTSVCMSHVVEGEQAGYVIVQFVDITKRKANEEELQRLATRDHLTGLSNRMVFDDALKLAAKKAQRYNRSGAVVYIDLDDFKSINDLYGHKAGDQALKEVAHVLKHVFRETDVVCRIGGDEFAVIMHEVSEGEAATKVSQVEKEISRLQVMAHGKNVAVSASLGVQSYNGDTALDIETLVENADRAMYERKMAGKEGWRSRA